MNTALGLVDSRLVCPKITFRLLVSVGTQMLPWTRRMPRQFRMMMMMMIHRRSLTSSTTKRLQTATERVVEIDPMDDEDTPPVSRISSRKTTSTSVTKKSKRSTITRSLPRKTCVTKQRKRTTSPSFLSTDDMHHDASSPHHDMKKTSTQQHSRLRLNGKPRISVMGIGGAGGNAINNMISAQLQGVDFIVANTDNQALGRSLATRKITLGTKGLGAGSKPRVGQEAAESARSEIIQAISDSNMLFLTGGLGGGTCTGACPVVAQIAKELDILTVGVMSTPFRSEGPNRTRLATAGIQALESVVDTLIVVPNQNLLRLSSRDTTMLDAFRLADDVLCHGIKGVTDLIMKPGLINLDFADVHTILARAGRAMMGSGTSSCAQSRAKIAAEDALFNPLLGELPIESATGLLVTISGSADMTLFEVDEIMEIIRLRVAEHANVIFGTCYDESLTGAIHVSIMVTGIQTDMISPDIATRRSPNPEPLPSSKPMSSKWSQFFSF